MAKKRIAIFQANLKVGGIQRSLVNLLHSNIFNDYEVDVYLFSRDIFFKIEDLTENIHIYFLKPFPYWFRFVPFKLLKIMKFYTELERKYDYAIDFDSYRQECAYCTTQMKTAQKVMWIHNDIKQELRFNKKYRILYLFFKEKYKYFDEFVAVSEGVVQPFRKYAGCKNAKITVIPNVINVTEVWERSQEHSEVKVDPTKCNIICVGRIYIQKGYDYLLNEFFAAYQIRRDLRCYIVGDGPDTGYYKKWVQIHGLSEAVYFLGNQKNPFSIMSQMEAFCLESRYEGQGMVLWEAKSLGLQLVFPKRLEKYNIYLQGVENVQEALVNLKKRRKEYDSLYQYHAYIEEQFNKLLNN